MKRLNIVKRMVQVMNNQVEIISLNNSLSKNLKGGIYICGGGGASQSIGSISEC